MLDRIRAETSDAEAEQILGALDLSDAPALRDASGQATPRQVFELVFPRAYAEHGELQERIRDETGGGTIRWIISGESIGSSSCVSAGSDK